MQNYVVLELSDRKDRVSKNACCTLFFYEAKISSIFYLSLAHFPLRKSIESLNQERKKVTGT